MEKTHWRSSRRTLTALLVLLVLLPMRLFAAPGLTVECVLVPHLAEEVAAEDVQAEEGFCGIDLADDSTAICPKIWSTSPGSLLYDLAGTSWEGRASAFETEVCPKGGTARDVARSELAIFKNSMNGRETSGTFAPASLLYYHLSRLLQTRVQVPVSVMAEFPADAYRKRVVVPGLQLSDTSRLKMLHAGWQEMDTALGAPGDYPHKRELLTSTGRLWGVFLLGEGHRYGPEVNGTRASGWGDGQNRDFQRTAPFLALRKHLPLRDAISSAVAEARDDRAMEKALPGNLEARQLAWWMNDISEIVILDTILKQQDRIGNIDYVWRWAWSEGGQVHLAESQPAVAHAVKIRVTVLNDNDAGVRSGYANYASRTEMLDGWHHINRGLYRRVQALGADFAAAGPIATAVRTNYRLSRREAEGVISRGIHVASQLRERCKSGELRFDLDLVQMLAAPGGGAASDKHDVNEQGVDCVSGDGSDSFPVSPQSTTGAPR